MMIDGREIIILIIMILSDKMMVDCETRWDVLSDDPIRKRDPTAQLKGPFSAEARWRNN